jgi:hypothetical protein
MTIKNNPPIRLGAIIAITDFSMSSVTSHVMIVTLYISKVVGREPNVTDLNAEQAKLTDTEIMKIFLAPLYVICHKKGRQIFLYLSNEIARRRSTDVIVGNAVKNASALHKIELTFFNPNIKATISMGIPNVHDRRSTEERYITNKRNVERV